MWFEGDQEAGLLPKESSLKVFVMLYSIVFTFLTVQVLRRMQPLSMLLCPVLLKNLLNPF